jgi:Secretion system C-terminal sorting domain
MKTKLLFTVALFISFWGFSQNNGWYVYDKALEITSITPDDTNTNELHLGTSLGYIKYNTATNTVTDFLNLTSQNPAIAKVKDIAVNPTNNTIAFTMPGAVVVYDGTTVTKYTYQNSNLTLGSAASTFTFLQVEYGVNGELYIFKEDVFGYQIFNNGVFETEVVTTFRPQDIVENNAGTKVYFAGWNNGLWELVKATSTLTNFTSSNSPLITNTLHSLHVDTNDLLYIGSFQGLNTMTPAGVWNTYQQLIPPFNTQFYPVYDISVNSTGGVLINTSRPSSQDGKGFCLVDLTTNTWTSYTNDATNCLNENYFDDATYDASDNIYVSHIVDTANTDNGQLVLFNPTTDTCTPKDINYLNAMVTSTFNTSDFNMRKKLDGTFDIGFTKFGDLYQFNISPTTFVGGFPNVTTLTPAVGQPAYSLISDNAFFIVENNAGWVFIDDANNATQFSHNLPNYLAIATKKAAAFDSSNGIINLIFKGFDAAFNYRVYKTQCNTATATCSVPEEMFTTNRDLTQNIFFGTNQNPTTNLVSVVALKTGSVAAGKFTKKTSKSEVFGGAQGITIEEFDAISNGPPKVGFDENSPGPKPFIQIDPRVFDVPKGSNIPNAPFFFSDNSTIDVRTLDGSNNSLFTDLTHDGNNDGDIDEFIGGCPVDNDRFKVELFKDGFESGLNAPNNSNSLENSSKVNGVNALSNGLFASALEIESIDAAGVPTFKTTNIPSATIDNDLPNDLFVVSVKCVQYSPTEIFLMFLTNYGILIKTAIDISNLLLSTDDISLKNANLLLYPNPANDIVSFSDNSIKNITVYDINGRKVLSTTNSNSFSVKPLAQGIYIVKGISENNVVVTKKLIVE